MAKVLLTSINSRKALDISEVPLITPPINLMYVAEYSRQAGHEVKVVDSFGENLGWKDNFSKVKKFNPDLIGTSIYSTDLKLCYDYLQELKNEVPQAKIYIGGHHATSLPQQVLEEFPMVDYVIRGEGEVATSNLATALEKGTPVSEVKGISYRENGKIRHNAPQPTIEDLDSIPIPGRDLVDSKLYYSRVTRRNPVDVIITTRGCPYLCTFCPKLGIDFYNYRERSPENVVEELKQIVDNGAKSIDFYDETFTLNHDRVYKILDLAKKEGLDFEFRVRTRVNAVNKELLHTLRGAGCVATSYGVESGNQQILDNIKKGTTLDMIRKAFAITKAEDINILAFFLMGLRGDTPETIEDTIKFACELNPSFATFNYVLPYPGTEEYIYSKENGMLQGEWGVNKPVPWIKLPWMTKREDVVNKVDKAFARFYYRPQFVANWMYRNIRQQNWNQIAYTARTAMKSFNNMRSVNYQINAENVD